MHKLLIEYLKHNWIIYSIVFAYVLLILFKAMGLDVWLPPCLISKTIGYSCFGCGLNTAAIHIIRFEFAEAFTTNPLIYLYVPLIIGWITIDFHKFKVQAKTTDKNG